MPNYISLTGKETRVQVLTGKSLEELFARNQINVLDLDDFGLITCYSTTMKNKLCKEKKKAILKKTQLIHFLKGERLIHRLLIS
jgi:hypothetical protein